MSCDGVLVQNRYVRLFIAAAWNPSGVIVQLSLEDLRKNGSGP